MGEILRLEKRKADQVRVYPPADVAEAWSSFAQIFNDPVLAERGEFSQISAGLAAREVTGLAWKHYAGKGPEPTVDVVEVALVDGGGTAGALTLQRQVWPGLTRPEEARFNAVVVFEPVLTPADGQVPAEDQVRIGSAELAPGPQTYLWDGANGLVNELESLGYLQAR